MANKLTDFETEAISLLQAGNPQAFGVMIKYFERMCGIEMVSCVDCNIDAVEIHRGRARAWRDAMNIFEDARKRLDI